MMMHPMMGPGKNMAMLLISLGIGYLVCAKAEEQKDGFIKQLGYWIGSIIIVLSILVPLKMLCFRICNKMFFKCPPAKICPMKPGKMMHGRMMHGK